VDVLEGRGDLSSIFTALLRDEHFECFAAGSADALGCIDSIHVIYSCEMLLPDYPATMKTNAAANANSAIALWIKVVAPFDSGRSPGS
jgi:hypothetical protein